MSWKEQKDKLNNSLITLDNYRGYFSDAEQDKIQSLRNQLANKKENEDLTSIQTEANILIEKYNRIKDVFNYPFYFISASTVANLAEAFRSALNTSSIMTIPEMTEKLVQHGDHANNQLASYIGGTLAGSLTVNTDKIRDYAFYGFDKLTQLDAPEATSIGTSAFKGCTALTKFSAPKATTCSSSFEHPMPFTHFTAGFTIANWKAASAATQPTFTENSTIKMISLPGVTNIEAKAFYKCTSLTSAYFTSSTGASIKDNAFADCTKLVTFSAPNFSGGIGTTAFKGCAFSTIDLPNITAVGNAAFSTCSKLKSVKLPKCTSLSANAFYSIVNNIENIDIGVATAAAIFSKASKLTSVTMSKATSVAANAFLGCEKLKDLSFPNLATVSTSAFAGCKALSQISFPKVVTIGTQAFAATKAAEGSSQEDLTSLEYVNFSNAATVIGKKAFENCVKLTWDLFLAPKLVELGENAFMNCTGITWVDASECAKVGTQPFSGCQLTYANLGKLTALPSTVFANSPIKSIELPACTTLNSSAFMGCGSLTHVVIPNCTKISAKAFYENLALSQITLEKISVIEPQAFEKCSKLKKVVILSTTVPTLSNVNAFANTSSELRFYVPASMVSAYAIAKNWSAYVNNFMSLQTMLDQPFKIYDAADYTVCFSSRIAQNYNNFYEMSVGSNENCHIKGFNLRVPFQSGSSIFYGNRSFYTIVDNNKVTGDKFIYDAAAKKYSKTSVDRFMYYTDDAVNMSDKTKWKKVESFNKDIVAGTAADNFNTDKYFILSEEI